MEESNARNEDFDTSSINNVKVALMGPLAGIGDSMFWGTLRVIATGIGTSLAMQGSILDHFYSGLYSTCRHLQFDIFA